MTTLSVADVLDRAADLISKPGAWTQGAFSRNADGSVDRGGDDGDSDGIADAPVCWCVLGSIAYIASAEPDDARTFSLIGGRLPAQAKGVLQDVVGRDVVTWNDDPDSTQDEIVAKLREAATLSRSSENRNGADHG